MYVISYLYNLMLHDNVFDVLSNYFIPHFQNMIEDKVVVVASQ